MPRGTTAENKEEEFLLSARVQTCLLEYLSSKSKGALEQVALLHGEIHLV